MSHPAKSSGVWAFNLSSTCRRVHTTSRLAITKPFLRQHNKTVFNRIWHRSIVFVTIGHHNKSTYYYNTSICRYNKSTCRCYNKSTCRNNKSTCRHNKSTYCYNMSIYCYNKSTCRHNKSTYSYKLREFINCGWCKECREVNLLWWHVDL